MLKMFFIKVVAIFSLRDSRAWKVTNQVGEDTIALVAGIPAMVGLAVLLVLIAIISGDRWLGQLGGVGILLALAIWYFLWLAVVRKATNVLSGDINAEISRLAELPSKKWGRIKNLATFLAWLVMFSAIMGGIVVGGISMR